MHCVKLLGQRLMARGFDRQVAEPHVRIAVPNRFTALGIPVAEAVGRPRPGKGEIRPNPCFQYTFSHRAYPPLFGMNKAQAPDNG